VEENGGRAGGEQRNLAAPPAAVLTARMSAPTQCTTTRGVPPPATDGQSASRMAPRFLVTAGPTREFFDPVRFVSNPSSGKMGYALARAARAAGGVVDLVSGPVALEPPAGLRVHRVVTGDDMLAAAGALFGQCDILVMTAAVCDFRPRQRAAAKVKKDALEMLVEFEPVPDILRTLSARRAAGQLLVGFAAETDNIEGYALRKLAEKDLDFIVANQVGGTGGRNAFESDDNHVVLFDRRGDRAEFGPASKDAVAEWLVARFLAVWRAGGPR